jgi:hypothetical protein
MWWGVAPTPEVAEISSNHPAGCGEGCEAKLSLFRSVSRLVRGGCESAGEAPVDGALVTSLFLPEASHY